VGTRGEELKDQKKGLRLVKTTFRALAVIEKKGDRREKEGERKKAEEKNLESGGDLSEGKGNGI